MIQANDRKNLVVFSDFHLHDFKDFAKPITYNFYGKEIETTDRMVAQIETLNEVFRIAHENNADLLFCGDFFHTRNKIPTQVYNIGFKSIYMNMQKYRDMYLGMVVGNHDQKDSTPLPEHSLEPFKAIDRVTVMDMPKIHLSGRGYNIISIPYSDDTEMLKKCIEDFTKTPNPRGTLDILAGHLGVEGSETGKNSHRLDGAFTVADLCPDHYDYVCLGHYHKRQQLGNRSNIFYVGNTIQTSFSDEGQDKGVILLDIEDGEKKEPKFIPIKNKKFVTLTEVDENTQDEVDNNYVRFVLPQDQAQEVELYKETSDNIRVEVQKEYKSETRIDIDVESTEESIVEEYTKEYYPETTEIAVSILKEAMMKG